MTAADIRENLVDSVEQHMIDEFARVTRMNRLTEAEAWEAWAHTEEAVNGFIQDEYDDA